MQRKGMDSTSLVTSGNSIETEENSKCVDETKTSLVDLARLTEQWHQLSIQKGTHQKSGSLSEKNIFEPILS